MTRTPAPWGISRMGPYAATTTLPAFTPVIDPETQIAVIVDENGRTVELGSHGTSTSGVTPTQTGPDGQPGAPTDADSYESYDQDQSSG
ncbi:putative ATP-grasp-modified RiPP [Streptomyces sp. NRRL WC-3742]|uniref:putative ATP-grasp-modified RiPP n=1 Tax=Streptomyces sp. NRRL WC-3742 TaxID=1463934 RepID=UPI0004CB87AD|nr:putative ATP-grasp-modified RiPP [Streptomyces sp. NRRL WC-3742]